MTGLPVTVCCCVAGKLLGPVKLPGAKEPELGIEERSSTGMRCALAAAIDKERRLAFIASLCSAFNLDTFGQAAVYHTHRSIGRHCAAKVTGGRREIKGRRTGRKKREMEPDTEVSIQMAFNDNNAARQPEI